MDIETPRSTAQLWILELVQDEAIDLLRDQERRVPERIGETQLDTVIAPLFGIRGSCVSSGSLVIYARQHPGSDFRRISGAIG